MANIKFTLDSFFCWDGEVLSGVNFGPKHFWGEQLQVFVHKAGLCGQGKFKHVFTQSPGTLLPVAPCDKTKSVSPIP